MLLSLTKLGAAGALAMGVWLSGSAAQATTSRGIAAERPARWGRRRAESVESRGSRPARSRIG